MRIVEKEELDEILKNHKSWLETRFSSKIEGAIANLRWANLRWANLSGADLRWG